MKERINISPTLIVGLGGTGSLALQYVKRKIRDRLEGYNESGRPLPRTIPFIEYLVLDTTAQEEIVDGWFVPDEYLNMGHLNISRIINNLEQDRDYNIQKWFPRKLDPGQIDSGAGGVRALGRLCFFVNESEIEGTLRRKVCSITEYAEVRKFLNENLKSLWMEEGSTIDTHIVSSLCGGTGSACLLDTCYLIKLLIADGPKQMANITVHLITSEPFEGEPGIGRTSREYIHSNFAITLSEIEHFTQKADSTPWDVEYRGGTKILSNEKPFSVAYLIGCKEGVSLSKSHVCEIVGETIAIQTVHQESRRIKGMIENFKPHVINTEDFKKKRRTYSSYNTHILNLSVDESMLSSAARVGARTILTELSNERTISQEETERVFKAYEETIFAAKMHFPHLIFEEFIKHLDSEVAITPGMFNEALRVARNVLSLPDRKRKKEAPTRVNAVLMTASAIETDILVKKELFLNRLNKSFEELHNGTDQFINASLISYGFPFVRSLLETIHARLEDLETSFDNYLGLFPDPQHNYAGDLIAAIENQTGDNIPNYCARNARAKIHGPILATFMQQLLSFRGEISKRIAWCSTAHTCLTDATKVFVNERRIAPTSLTRSYVWSQDDLEQLILQHNSRFVKKFLTILEQRYARDSDLNPKVSFLPHLNDTVVAKTITEKLALEASTEALHEEIGATEELKRKEGLRRFYELVDLASPPWQIERLGEDVAVVSLTTCPQDSDSGEILSRSGTSLNFSRNGHDENEYMVFRSEHGISVNHLVNFRRCLKAVKRKMHAEGRDRINDLCLDPSWNIAAPLPIDEEMEELLLHFSLGILFGILKQEPGAYVFKTPSGREVKLRKQLDITKTVKRFEAFDKLLDLDCEGSNDCQDFRRSVENEITNRQQISHIHEFRAELLHYKEGLGRLLVEARDPRDQKQLEKEIRGIGGLLNEIETFFKETRREEYGS